MIAIIYDINFYYLIVGYDMQFVKHCLILLSVHKSKKVECGTLIQSPHH